METTAFCFMAIIITGIWYFARVGDEARKRVRYILGVPGHYYSSEKYMASMFGFPHFCSCQKTAGFKTAGSVTGMQMSVWKIRTDRPCMDQSIPRSLTIPA